MIIGYGSKDFPGIRDTLRRYQTWARRYPFISLCMDGYNPRKRKVSHTDESIGVVNIVADNAPDEILKLVTSFL